MPRTEVTGAQIRDASVSLTADVTGVLPVSNGGIGSGTISLGHVVVGNGTGAVLTVAPGTAGNVLTSNGTSWVSQIPESAQNSVTSVAGRTGVITLTVSDVSGAQAISEKNQANGYAGLDSTARVPVANVNGAQAISEKNQANGYAGLDSTGKVPLEQWADQTIDCGGATVTVIRTIDGGSA